MNQIQRLLLQTLRSGNVVAANQRYYGRWMHRNPRNVYLPFEGSSLKKEKIIDFKSVVQEKDPKAHDDNLKKNVKKNKALDEELQLEPPPSLTPEKREEIKNNKKAKITKAKFNIKNVKVFDENNDVIFEKLKDNDGRISPLLLKLKSKKDRAQLGQVLVEGWRLVVDGLEAKCRLTHLIFTKYEELNKIKPYLPNTGVLVYKIPYKEIQLWSDVETSPGVFGIFEKPDPNNMKRFAKPLGLNIICDNIRVPGNLGAILRVAVGAGCQNVYLIKGCVDMWDPKVVRSAAGAHFRLPIHTVENWEKMTNVLDSESSIFVADNNTEAALGENHEEILNRLNSTVPVIPYYSVDYGVLPSITLIIGGETEGISKECFSFATQRKGVRLNIPLHKGVDSLNSGMAAAVIAFEIKKQILQRKENYFYGRLENKEVISQ